ncbi:HPr kinase/phosphorylase [Denitrobaculum tricleocarpae]|uniref:Serine/threonine protein kinase n=1 Tax=Denitrobaculum tricleocarpae TaxID=2591009 RepID=A0A545TG43_9PROT|nr:HPr kinase/phosphatase C-terminal domain-containing protein [Denitrobaculum tricleocarpae]TQV76183.1 serine/threonine protein kinase [Denitrobaculum tricleocarpae]
MAESLVHATCVAVPEDRGQGTGILLLGPSGAGKSDLALRLIDQGAQLVADDQTCLSLQGEKLWAEAPASLAGRIEVRGLGILKMPYVEKIELSACFNLVEATKIERLPELETRSFLGISLPSLDLFPFEASASLKLRLAVREMSGFIMDQD